MLGQRHEDLHDLGFHVTADAILFKHVEICVDLPFSDAEGSGTYRIAVVLDDGTVKTVDFSLTL